MVALLLSASSKVLSLDKPYEWVAPSQNSNSTQPVARPQESSIVMYSTPRVDPNSLIKLKIIIVGESGVGKSSMLLGFIDNTYTLQRSVKSTIGVDYSTVNVVRSGKTLRLNFFDTAGTEVYRALTPSYFRNAHGAIVVYDVSDRKTFKKMQGWINEVDTYSYNDNLAKMVVGNKIDKSGREVCKEEGFLLACKNRALFVETSVKTREGIEAAFDSLVDEMLLNMNRRETPPGQPIASVPAIMGPPNKCC